MAHLLLAVVLLAAALAGVCMLMANPTSQLVWGLGCAAVQPGLPQLTAVDLAAGTPTHGHLVKRGPQSSLEALAQGRNILELSYLPEGDWATQRLAGSAPPFPSKWCAAMFNDKYRLIYVKCPKTASTSLVDHFGDCTFDSRDTCLAFVRFDNASEVQHVVSHWQDFFVFGFTRNVLARAVSMYRYLAHFMPACRRVAWDEFCANPFVLGDVCRRAESVNRPCCETSPEHQYVHVLPQAHCFTTANNESAVDWLGRVEHFETDLAALVQLLNSRPGVPQLQLPAQAVKTNLEEQSLCQRPSRRHLVDAATYTLAPGTFNPCDPADYFRGAHAHCYGDVLQHFGEDVSFLYTRQPHP
ncbi:Sulfotransferase family [Chlorella sorokiniana]|uniref:Sulfotransferase family n=1 Tax=Chlorella sorokiniana TaxID=3076 RepID=A0A2P6U3V2_CHLSO|nr:Sulfotransferase family [Chlorella sorokiniana]|eukprot:PRW60994.1 Sulfotransferase family [Chlorella sorokiniana]